MGQCSLIEYATGPQPALISDPRFYSHNAHRMVIKHSHLSCDLFIYFNVRRRSLVPSVLPPILPPLLIPIAAAPDHP